MTLSEMAAIKKTLEIDSAEANKIQIAIGKMVALDIQPYSIVEDVGFKSLVGLLEPRYIMPSRKYFSEKIIPDMYITVRARVQSEIYEARFICLTTDTWTARHSTESFISLTAHWINENFARKYAVLHCEHFTGKHTGLRLAESLTEMLNKWKIERKKVHVVLHDTGPNMVKATNKANLKNVSCFSHTL